MNSLWSILVGAFWRQLYRLGLARSRLGYWRVVVEGRPKDPVKSAGFSGAVTAVFVWAHDPEEAEALARLSVEADGLDTVTADATAETPDRAPRRTPGVAGRIGYAFYGADGPEEVRQKR
jgi:hypothetical protein